MNELRDVLVQHGSVRAIVRLPKGLVISKPRQALALWVLGPAYRTGGPHLSHTRGCRADGGFVRVAFWIRSSPLVRSRSRGSNLMASKAAQHRPTVMRWATR